MPNRFRCPAVGRPAPAVPRTAADPKRIRPSRPCRRRRTPESVIGELCGTSPNCSRRNEKNGAREKHARMRCAVAVVSMRSCANRHWRRQFIKVIWLTRISARLVSSRILDVDSISTGTFAAISLPVLYIECQPPPQPPGRGFTFQRGNTQFWLESNFRARQRHNLANRMANEKPTTFTWFPPLFGLMNTKTGVIRAVGTAFMMNAFDSFSLVRCLMRTSFLRGVFLSDDLKLPLRGSLTIHDGGTIMLE